MIDSHASNPETALDGALEAARAPRAQDVLFLLLRDFMLLDLARLVDTFRCANAELPGSYRLRFAALTQNVPVIDGLTVSGCESLPEELPAEAILVVPGGAAGDCRCDPRDPAVRRIIDWLHSAGRARHLVCISSGAVLAAHAGLLSHRECTTDTEHVAQLRRAEPSARVLASRSVVEDGRVLTSAGVSGGVDLALRLIGRQLGAGTAAKIARRLLSVPPRAGASRSAPPIPPREPLHPAVRRVQDAVSRDPTARWTAADLAATACTSSRHLSRLFHEAAGCPPLHYVQQVRLRRAKEIMMQSRLDLKSVAAHAGFRSAQHLRRVWSLWESRPPSDFRSEQHRALRAGGLTQRH